MLTHIRPFVTEPNTDYVLTLSAFNAKGPGTPVYEQVRTRAAGLPDTLLPPVGLKAVPKGPHSVEMTWTDPNEKGPGQYVVRYWPPLGKPRHVNVTNLGVTVDNLKPNTEYEFTVRVIKVI